MRHLLWIILLLPALLVFAIADVQLAENVGATDPVSIPAPVPGGPRPTISLSTNHASAGQTVAVNGQGVAPYPSVRIAWLTGEATRTAAIADRQAADAYSATITVPIDAATGPAKVCAAVTGSAQAEFVCAEFTVEAPVPGSVHGRFPEVGPAGQARVQATFDAKMNLYDRSGRAVASAPIGSDGSFSFSSVPAGRYTAGVAGTVPFLVENTSVQVEPGRDIAVNLTPVGECAGAAVVAVRASPAGPPSDRYDFGTYINQVGGDGGPEVSFEVDVQTVDGAQVSDLNVYLADSAGRDFYGSVPTRAGSTWRFSETPGLTGVAVKPGIDTLSFEPVVSYTRNGQNCSRARNATRTINLVDNPFSASPFTNNNLFTYRNVLWQPRDEVYSFEIRIPDPASDNGDFIVDGKKLLPLQFPDPPLTLPLLGTVDNSFRASLFMTGTVDLNQKVRVYQARLRSQATILGQEVYNDDRNLLPKDSSRVAFNPGDLKSLSVDLPTETLAKYDKEVPVFDGVLGTFFGVVTVRMSFSVGIHGDLVLSGSVRPLAPAVNFGLAATVRPRLNISIIADVLGGVGSAGADAITQALLKLITHLDSDDPRLVHFDDSCVRIQVLLRFWVRVNLLFASKQWNTDLVPLIDQPVVGSCPTDLASLLAQADDVPPPRVLASPSIAGGPGSRLLAVYVEDTAPTGVTPAMQVMARFWDPAADAFGPAQPLTDGSRAVQDPVAAFVGTDGTAIVAWTENTETPAEDEANGNDLNAHLRRQEIKVSFWNGSTWSAPSQLTDDTIPDGRTTLAGDATGATLAWVRLPGGDTRSNTDQRIAVMNWDLASRAWSPLEVLNAASVPARNAQVSAARASGHRILAWAVDADGDINTNADRTMAVADWDDPSATWRLAQPGGLGAGVDWPNITLEPTGQQAFLTYRIRGKDGDGKTDTGIGNQAQIWSARRDATGTWQASPLKDEAGQPVRGERPQIDASSGQPLLLVRRFGQAGTNGEVGQLALTQLNDAGATAPPMYLTDEPRQHWQPALAVNRGTGQAVVLNVSRAAAGAGQTAAAAAYLRPAAQGARVGITSVAVTAGTDPIESLTVEPGADPALDPALGLSQAHAAVGSSVVVTATVRNLGRGPADNLTVKLYQGTPGSGTLLSTNALTGPLAFNESRPVTFSVVATSGPQPIYAEVTTTGSNTGGANDRAIGEIGALPAPTLVQVFASVEDPSALEIAWQAPAVPDVAGYRILRSQSPGGPYELVGEATGTSYRDVLLSRGTTYQYLVQAYDAGGVLSANSQTAAGALPATPTPPTATTKAFLPLLAKDATAGW